MSIPSVMSNALSGMKTQMSRLARAADEVARTGAPGPDTPAGSGAPTPVNAPAAISPIERNHAEILHELSDAEKIYKANAAVFEAGADLWDVLMAIRRD